MAFDLDALAAETEPAEPFTFTFGGEDYTFPAEPDLVAASLVEKRDYAAALERLLGPEQWVRMSDSESKMTPSLFFPLLVEYTASLGTSPGESEGSTSS